MTKTEFINAVAEESGFSKSQSKKIVDAFTNIVTGTLAKGENVRIQNFGTFDTYRREARDGFNPRTKEPIDIPEMRVARFKPSKELKNTVN